METLTATSESVISSPKIPSFLVRETIDSKPYYYKGYQKVLNQTLTFEEIMGSSDTQSLLIHLILQYFYRYLPSKQYIFAGNESGLHIGKNDNLALDIAIYDKVTVLKRGFRNQYFDIPPLAVIEVDAKTEATDETDNYYFKKIQKLLDFGVKEIIWIFSDTQKIIFARQNQDWLVMDWSKEILLLNEYAFCVKKLLDDEGIDLFPTPEIIPTA